MCGDANFKSDVKPACIGECVFSNGRCISLREFSKPDPSQTLDCTHCSFGDEYSWLQSEFVGCWKYSAAQPLSDSFRLDNRFDTDIHHKCSSRAYRKRWPFFGIARSTSEEFRYFCIELPEKYYAMGPSKRCPGHDLSSGAFYGTDVQESGYIALAVYRGFVNGLQKQQPQLYSPWLSTDISYVGPEIIQIEGANNAPTNGGNKVRIRGTSFG